MLLETVAQIGRLRRTEAVVEMLSGVVARLGYSVLAIGAPGRGAMFTNYFFSTWPPDWIDLYIREGFMRDDPIPVVAGLNAMPFLWSDMVAGRAGTALSPAQLRAYALAAEWGYREGVVVPIHGPGAYLVLASYGGANPDTSPGTVAMLHLLTLHAHVRLAALYAAEGHPAVPAPGTTTLTGREVEALGCVLAGLSDAATALRMGVSERTVRFHLANARTKLGARSRAQAVSAALAIGLLRG